MVEPRSPETDPRKVRIGLAIIVAVTAVAAVLLFVIDDSFGRMLMLAVVALGFVRVALLVRSLRRGG